MQVDLAAELAPALVFHCSWRGIARLVARWGCRAALRSGGLLGGLWKMVASGHLRPTSTCEMLV